jgi:isoquinoline 1-oxidoreductase beta subunit
VADGYWRALQGVRALEPRFTDGGNAAVSTATLVAAQREALAGTKLRKAAHKGRGADFLPEAARVIEAEYRVPLLAHATMEPMSTTARIAEGRCELWTGVQDPLSARKVAAKAAGLDVEQVTLHNHALGGGFGRRLPGAFDFVEQAVRIAKAVTPRPVKLTWSREEDIQHDFYRPGLIAQYQGGLDAAGRPVAWSSKFNGAGMFNVPAPPYDIEHLELRTSDVRSHVREGSWRSVEFSHQGFFIESFIDELAHAAGKDPVEFRLAALTHAPRHHAVVQKAAQLTGWGSSLPAGHGRGIALVEAFGTIVAEVAEVEVTAERAIRVHRVVAVVDCGEVIHPDTAAAQIEGGIVFGLSAALFDEITVENGGSCRAISTTTRCPGSPTRRRSRCSSSAGARAPGEPGVPPVAPAVANAVFAATGERLRALPLRLI